MGRHFDFATLDDLIDRLGERKHRGRPRAVLSFDDALECAYHGALEFLSRRGIPFLVAASPGLLRRRRSIWSLELDVLCLLSDRPEVVRPEMEGFPPLTLPLKHRGDRIAASKKLRAEIGELGSCPFEYVTKILEHFGVPEFEELTKNYPHFRIATMDQLRGLQNRGMTPAAHGFLHVPLDTIEEVSLQREVVGAKEALEEDLGAAGVHHFVLPFGRFSPRVLRVVQEAGFRSCCTTVDRPIEPGDGAFELPRVEARGGGVERPSALLRRLA
jgi:peptidoglycan/xylan/chitin deacetylase (PgdA/CDA1 family)